MTVTTRNAARKRSHGQSSTNKQEASDDEHDSKRLEELPREVRDQIYRESLISSSHIDVSLLKCHQEYRDSLIQTTFDLDPKAPARSLEGLNFSLLKANSQIAREAAEIFYSKNKFAFHGHKDWSVVVEWLQAIGEENRRHLTSLELDVRQLKRVWQYEDGSREGWDEDEKVNPRHPLLNKAEGESEWPAGEVDDIDPNMEDVFFAVAECKGGSKLTLHLRYIGGGYPGAFEDLDNINQDNEVMYFSMDLPNLVEAWRVKHSNKGKQIDVLWYLWGDKYDDKNTLDLIEDQLKDNGFEILDFNQFSETVESLVYPGQFREQHGNKITIRRKPLEGPIIRSPPNPYTSMIPPAEEREENAS
ncbi:hypothetical protein C1H76_9595 [Elsinoe australis]|uniref:Uncharacterized protein n=1 Tax=Elsinoe australis TaxID=40998 RepID=A0A4V6DSU6_9PEZI|nr:hypothetical protein C1H76_9595 [Elsinoe australis]